MGAFLKLLRKILDKMVGKKSTPPAKPQKPYSHSKSDCTTRCRLKVQARRPAKRHNPCKTSGKDPTKSNNSMIEPDVDISSDIKAFNSGDFIRKGEDYIVGKRIYGMHPDTGSVFPKSGLGIVSVSRAQHQLLKALNSGSYANAMLFAKNNPGLTKEQIETVLQLWSKCK